MLQAAWAQVLMMLTGHRDVAFGTAVSGRPAELSGADSIVGLLINTVPVRAKAGADSTVADLLAEVQRHHNDTLEHEHLPLTEIHHLTGQDHLFDTLFLYESYPIDTSAFMGVHELAVTDFVSREYNHYPLSVMALPVRSWGCGWSTTPTPSTRAASPAWSPASAGARGDDRQCHAAALGHRRPRRHRARSARGVEQRRGAERGRAHAAVVPEVFAAQVARTFDAPAVTFEGRSMSYAEVDEASNRLAHYLVDRGAGRGSLWRCCCRVRRRRS